MPRELTDSERLESIRKSGNGIFLMLCALILWQGWQVRELRALRSLPGRGCESGHVDGDAHPPLPVLAPVAGKRGKHVVPDAAERAEGHGSESPIHIDRIGAPERFPQHFEASP